MPTGGMYTEKSSICTSVVQILTAVISGWLHRNDDVVRLKFSC
jgi:hypothetical protein